MAALHSCLGNPSYAYILQEEFLERSPAEDFRGPGR